MGKRSRIMVVCAALVALPVLGGGVARGVSEPGSSSPARGTAATTSPPPALVRSHFEGRHSGIEHFQGRTAQCPVLDHRLREIFTLRDGTDWSFRSHYCGTVDSHALWTGVGSFTITTANGSTFSGTFTESAQLPSVGVPYVIDVLRGTGGFAGGAAGVARRASPHDFTGDATPSGHLRLRHKPCMTELYDYKQLTRRPTQCGLRAELDAKECSRRLLTAAEIARVARAVVARFGLGGHRGSRQRRSSRRQDPLRQRSSVAGRDVVRRQSIAPVACADDVRAAGRVPLQ